MNAIARPSRHIGFAEAVRQAGDGWRFHGYSSADKINDSLLARAFVLSGGGPSAHDQDAWKMQYIIQYHGPNV